MQALKSIFLIVVLFSLLSCNKPGVITFKSFPSNYNLMGEKIELEIPLKFATLFFFDSLLVVTNTFDSKKYIHLFNRTKLTYISSSATIGQGPGEISNPFLANLDYQNRIIWCMDHAKRELLKFPIDSIVKKPDYTALYKVPLPSVQRLIVQYLPYNKNLFSFLNMDFNPIISFFNQQGEVIDSLNIQNKIGYYTDYWDDLKESNTIPYIHKFNPTNDKIVIAFRFADIIKILDFNGEILSSIQGPDIINQAPILPATETIGAYFDVQKDDDYIYCLYNGKQKILKSNGNLIPSFPKSLFVFDWGGHPISRLDFEYSVSSFAIDQINHRIVTFSPDFGDFIVYKLPEF